MVWIPNISTFRFYKTKHFKRVQNFAKSQNVSKAAILAVTETWLDSSIGDGEVTIENYSIVRFDRTRHGGGVCVYVRNGLNFNVRSDLVGDGLVHRCDFS
jgi:hypothetical protein